MTRKRGLLLKSGAVPQLVADKVRKR
jgi:hypothetical protein